MKFLPVGAEQEEKEFGVLSTGKGRCNRTDVTGMDLT